MNFTTIITLVSEIGVLASVILPIVVSSKKIANGTKCQLRSEMLRIYYRNHENKKIRQYEYQNFVELHGAYKALKGNSFIDKIYEEIRSWEIIT